MTTFQKSLSIIGILAIAILIYLLSSILMPFLIGAILAYLGDPLVNRLVKLHLPRSLAATIVFSVITLLILCLLLLLFPLLQDQISIFILKIPAIIDWVENSVLPWVQDHFDISLKSALMAHWQQAGNVADTVVKTLGHSTKRIIEYLINLILIPVVTFYLLRDWPKLIDRMRNLVPRKYLDTLSELLRQCNDVLSAFFRGQFLVMLALGIVYSAGLALIGINFALLIGVMIAFLSIVPYLGTIIGLVVAVTAAFFQFHDVTHIVYVLILFVIGHILEGMVLTPLLIGNRVGLHPVAVIFAILAGGALFGFFGILLALPVAAVVMVLLRFFYRRYTNSEFYKK